MPTTVPAKALSPALPNSRDEALGIIVLICGTGLLTSLLLLSRGVDLSPGFF